MIWFLFLFCLIVSIWAVIVRICLMYFRNLRYSYIAAYNKHIDDKYFRNVLSNSSYAYWFIIYLLSVNLEPMHFRDVILAINFFKDKQELPTKLIAEDLPLKKKLQDGYIKSLKNNHSGNGQLIVQIPDNKEVEIIDRDISNVETLERNRNL